MFYKTRDESRIYKIKNNKNPYKIISVDKL